MSSFIYHISYFLIVNPLLFRLVYYYFLMFHFLIPFRLVLDVTDTLGSRIPPNVIFQSLSDIWDRTFNEVDKSEHHWISECKSLALSSCFNSIEALTYALSLLYETACILNGVCLQSKDLPSYDIVEVVSDLIFRLTTPVSEHGLWSDSSYALMEHFKSLQRRSEGSDRSKGVQGGTFKRLPQIESLVNLWDITVLFTFHSVNRVLDLITSQRQSLSQSSSIHRTSVDSSSAILGRLRTFGYQLLRKVGSDYHLVSFAALNVLSQISSLCSIDSRGPEDFISEFSPLIVDALAFDLHLMKQRMNVVQNGSVKIDDGIGAVLLASVVLGSEDAILAMSDIVMELKNFASLPILSSLENGSSGVAGYQFPVWVFRVLAAISKRMSDILASREVLDLQSTEHRHPPPDPVETENTVLRKLAGIIVGEKDSHVFFKSRFPTSSTSRPSDSHSSDGDVLPDSYLVMTDLLLTSSQLCLLHPDVQLQHFAHLTCLRALHCASAKQSHLLPRIHQVS